MTDIHANWQRVLTAATVGGLALVAFVMAARVAPFSIAELRSGDGPDRAATLEPWRDTLGVEAAARDPTIPLARTQADAAGLEERRLKDYLSVRPVSPVKWLSLARLELSRGEPMKRVVGTFRMAQLTGPYEGYVMVQRALFGVLIWEQLGPDAQMATARDIVLADLVPPYTNSMRLLIESKSKDAQKAIRFNLLQIDGVTPGRMAAIGVE